MKFLVLSLLIFIGTLTAQTPISVTVTLGSGPTASSVILTGTITPRVLLTGGNCIGSSLGAFATCTVNLNIPAPGDLTVTVGAYQSGVTGPTSFTIRAGANSGSFIVTLIISAHAILNPTVTNWTYGSQGIIDLYWGCGVNPVFMSPGPFFNPMVWMDGSIG
jgi:hypothetical protein